MSKASAGADRPATTPGLIAQIWHTLEWRKTLQVAFVIAVAGAVFVTGLGLLAHAMAGCAAAWSAASSAITAVISYRTGRRRR
jgi:hypothetical protein